MIYKKHILTAKIVIDLLLASLASGLAFWVRLDNMIMFYLPSIKLYLSIALVMKLVLILLFKTNKQVWRHSSVQDLFTLVKLATVFILAQSTMFFFIGPTMRIPRSIPILDGFITLVFLGLIRLVWRFFRERHLFSNKSRADAKRVLIIGAGDAGTMIAKEMLRYPESGMSPVGFLDDDVAKFSQHILGLPVFGDLERLPEITKSYDLDEVLIAIPSAPGEVTRRVIDLARKAQVPFRIIPALYDLVSGTVSISSIRNIEVEDLLRRDPVKLDMENIASYLEGKVVLVTGAGGSIGSELVRQICRFNPGHIILLGRGENSLFNIENQTKKTFPDISFSTVVCDVRNSRRVERIFQEYAPQVVFHAAAHKHVPMMERNPEEAILNNVGGTQNLVKSALECGVQRFVNISTDKAVNPTSIMGASKRAAEMVVRRAAKNASQGQSFISVRFGNVLGSRGSVIPMFREQIRHGGPVTVTHPDMQRYFMTIPEASQLVLQAAAMNGNGAVYVLDMGDPVKIVDLAKDLIKLSGLEPYTDIDITYTGIRPGEKLFEELLTAEEGTLTTKHDKIFSAKSPTLPQDLEEKMEVLFRSAHAADRTGIYKALENLIPRSNFEYLNKMKKIKDINEPIRSSQDIPMSNKRENL